MFPTLYSLIIHLKVDYSRSPGAQMSRLYGLMGVRAIRVIPKDDGEYFEITYQPANPDKMRWAEIYQKLVDTVQAIPLEK